ncbi:proline rich transmembrane protein 1B-like [Pomacea canaliculata]|nr:proline rich transmembrane protein 1B-like [Pomacea canaliculata]
MSEKLVAEEKAFPPDPPPPYLSTEQSYPPPQYFPPTQQEPGYLSYHAGQSYPGQTVYPAPMQYTQPGTFSSIVVAPPVRENTPPPRTKTSFIISILALIFCVGAWPCGVTAIICNRRAKSQVELGQHTLARSSLRTAAIFIICTVVFGIIAWVIFGVQLWNVLRIIKDSTTTAITITTSTTMTVKASAA